MSVLDLTEVSVALAGTRIVTGVTATVAEGEWLSVIGPNGAGKSTLLSAVSGVLPCDGSVTWHGRAVNRMSRRERARRIALVPQSPVVPPGISVFAYVLLGRTPHIPALGRESVTDRDVAWRVCERLDLTGFAERRLDTLSGGERQRVFLARALAQLTGEAEAVLLLDEPTTALDIGHQQEVLELVDVLRRDDGLTVVSTMHDLSIAGQYADRLLLLSRGEVAAIGSPAEVLTVEAMLTHYGARVQVVAGPSGPMVLPVRPEPG